MICKNRFLPTLVILGSLGTVLCICGALGILDAFWCGMGCSFLAVAGLRLVQYLRYRKDADYRERVDVAASDERNRFISGRAWAWAGYLFILIAAVGAIALLIVGREDLMRLCLGAVWLMALLYALCYMILQRKY